jgi:hypothetical protein
MIRLRVSRRTFRVVAWCVLAVGLLFGLYFLGKVVTPLNSTGCPQVLSPSLRAAEMYRAQAQEWAVQLAAIDRRLTVLLAEETTSDPTELYGQSREMQEIGEDAANLVQKVTIAEVPVAMVGLREQAQMASNVYLEAALLTARWLSAPSEAGRTEAVSVLMSARELRITLEESRWLEQM